MLLMSRVVVACTKMSRIEVTYTDVKSNSYLHTAIILMSIEVVTYTEV